MGIGSPSRLETLAVHRLPVRMCAQHWSGWSLTLARLWGMMRFLVVLAPLAFTAVLAECLQLRLLAAAFTLLMASCT